MADKPPVTVEHFARWEKEVFDKLAELCREACRQVVREKRPEPQKAVAAAHAMMRQAAAQLIVFKSSTETPHFHVTKRRFLELCSRAYDAMAEMSGWDEASQTTGQQRMEAVVASAKHAARSRSEGQSIDDVVEQDTSWEIPQGFFPGKGGSA